ncbi:glycosyltransferase [Idiomarina xiamenensis]|uniref:Membrane-associated protein n=1 Tax=Idiomarina xiamenensis 10-D-4 TaxID=740709 RepID=K2KDL8_9GAMM|nr:glycosyltransferase [Idiomarina xiamenensis]EKE84822.1 membrane-associated protein [Idiomarina xiamenensis 10-D-4]
MMRKVFGLKAMFYLNIVIVAGLIGYQIYLNFFEKDYITMHTVQLDRIEQQLQAQDKFSFAVVGNINNSVGVFERKIVPRLNQSGVDFLVSAGNATSGGGEDKYRALYGTLSHLEIPYLLTFGENEASNLGDFRFYQHFGPYFYEFSAANSQFIFLDVTTPMSFDWQLRWLEDVLKSSTAAHKFVFMGKPLLTASKEAIFDSADNYLRDTDFTIPLLTLFSQYKVDAVFSSNLAVYDRQRHGDTEYIITGGAGGLMLNNDVSFYHYVEVTVDGDQISIAEQPLDVGQNQFWRTLESLWFFIHSLFYVGYLNFILLLSAFIVIAIKLYSKVFRDRDYYPNFDIDPSPYEKQPLRVAMVTNNYLPFIGGVPISIERLQRGLSAAGNAVLIIAPDYPFQAEQQQQIDQQQPVRRIPVALSFGENKDLQVANAFSPRIHRELRQFKPDVVHLHHPFWLSYSGMLCARSLAVPVVYTYHTRLEHYAHFVPLPTRLFRNFISHLLIKHFAERCDGIIVPTYSAEEYLRMIGVKKPIFVQPTGIDYDKFQQRDEAALQRLRRQLKLADDELVYVTVSRLSQEKNIDFMLDAIAELKQREHRPFRFIIIGDGDERSRIESRINTLGLSDVVILTGAIPPEQMVNYYQLGDIFLFASKSETQGMVILEAMAAGLPVVAVRSSGIDDVVQHKSNGYKTPENIEVWLRQVERLSQQDELRQRLANQAQQFAKDYAIEHFAEDIKHIYAHVIAAKKQAKAKH